MQDRPDWHRHYPLPIWRVWSALPFRNRTIFPHLCRVDGSIRHSDCRCDWKKQWNIYWWPVQIEAISADEFRHSVQCSWVKFQRQIITPCRRPSTTSPIKYAERCRTSSLVDIWNIISTRPRCLMRLFWQSLHNCGGIIYIASATWLRYFAMLWNALKYWDILKLSVNFSVETIARFGFASLKLHNCSSTRLHFKILRPTTKYDWFLPPTKE